MFLFSISNGTRLTQTKAAIIQPSGRSLWISDYENETKHMTLNQSLVDFF